MTGIWMGVIALVIGVGSLVNWWFVMFSDCWYAEFQRELSKAWFNRLFVFEGVVGGAYRLV